jgi:hypothetical protein
VGRESATIATEALEEQQNIVSNLHMGLRKTTQPQRQAATFSLHREEMKNAPLTVLNTSTCKIEACNLLAPMLSRMKATFSFCSQHQ